MMNGEAQRATFTNDRLHALDAVRACALLLGIVLHGTMSFLPGFADTGWPIIDASSSTTLSIAFYVIHMFRMTVFFLIAGFFAHLAYHVKGSREFVRDRRRRILKPLVLAWIVFLPVTVAVFAWAAKRLPRPAQSSGLGRAMLEQLDWTTLPFPLAHLWFLWILLVFYAVTLMLRTLLTKNTDFATTIREQVDRYVKLALSKPWFVVVLAAPLWLVFSSSETWIPWLGIPSNELALVPRLAVFVGHGVAFVLGWMLHRQVELLPVLARNAWTYLPMAVAGTTACLMMVGAESQFVRVAMDPFALVQYALLYSATSWAWALGLVGLAVKLWSSESAWRRYLADSSYWLYLAHLPLVFALQVLIAEWPLHWALKFPLLVTSATALLLLSYHYLVRTTWIGQMLSGRKYPRAARIEPVDAATA